MCQLKSPCLTRCKLTWRQAYTTIDTMSSHNLDTRTKILTATWELMEKQRGQNVHMSHIAKAAGISRQAVYLHFESRTELMIATIEYVDEVKGLNERMAQLTSASNGNELLEKSVDIWGNYIPEIYGLAKALLSTRDTDEAAAAAWNNSMGCLRDACQAIIYMLDGEGSLAPAWSIEEAIEMLYTMLSIPNWEQLTVESGWSNAKYVDWMITVAKRTFVQKTVGEE